MAKIFAAPIAPPDITVPYTLTHEEWTEQDRVYIDKLAALAKKNANGGQYDHLLGTELRFPAADGYARYMVWNIKPFQVVHIALHDAWRAHHLIEKGMDLREALSQYERTKHPLFGNSRKEKSSA